MKKIYTYIDKDMNLHMFAPTDAVVQRDYQNGRKGDALWVQIKNMTLVENYYTEREIFALMNNGYNWIVLEPVQITAMFDHHVIKTENIPTVRNKESH